jgi:gliding motility-associated-like protein
MKIVKLLFYSVLVLFSFTNDVLAQGSTCPGTPFCTAVGTPFDFANTHNGSAATGATSYGCLGSEPDPSWFYLKTSAAGTMKFTLTQGTTPNGNNLDVDFVCYGPFSAATFNSGAACTQLTGGCTGGAGNTTPNPGCSGNIVDCSFSPASTEQMTIVSPGAGSYYIIMITNYTGTTSPPGTAGFITFTQTSGPGSDCSITCNPTALTLAGQVAATNANQPSGSTVPCGSPFWVEPAQPTFSDPTNDIWTPCLMADFNVFNTNENTNGHMTVYEAGSPYGPTVYDLCNGCAQGTIGGAIGTTGTELFEYLSFMDSAVAHPVVFCNTSTVGTTTISLKNCWDGTVYAGPVVWNTSTAGCFTLTVPATAHLGSAIYSISPAGGGSGVFDYHDGNAYVDPNLIAAGTYTLTYTFHGRDGCAPGIGTYVFTVPAKPAVTVTAPSSICSGTSKTLTAGGATTYSWSVGSTSASISVSPSTTTSYTVTGTTSGCSTATVTTVSVTPTPTLAPTAASPTICSSGSTILNANPTGGPYSYTWTPGGATTSTVSVNPGSTQIYTVTATNGGLCAVTKTVSVNVTTTPTMTISASGGGNLCSGNSVTLTGGTAASYSWNTGATTSSISVSPAVTTTYTLTGTNGTCTASATQVVTVTTTPTMTVGTTGSTICSGQSVTLTSGTAASYSWNTGATTSGITVSPGATTTYTVTGTNGTCTSSATAVVTVTTTPTMTISAAGGGNLCSGNSITLTGGTAGSYSWNTGATTSSISVSPAVTTTYTLTGSNGTCTASATQVVTVTTTPTMTISTSGSSICSGSSVTLTGGTAASYSWNTGAVTSSISVSPAVTTTYTLTGTNGTCTATATSVVTVTTTPTMTIAAVGGGNICSGSSVTLNGGTAASYSWNTGAVTASISVSPISTTTYTLTGSNGTCTATAVKTVTVTTTPTMTIGTSGSNICSGSSVTLNGGTAASYSWNTGAVTSSISVSPAVTTTYTLTGTNGTCTASATAVVTVTTTPTMTISASGGGNLCSGNSITLTGGTAGSYSWNTGAVTSSISVSPAVTTTYTLTGSNGTCTATATQVVTVTTTPTMTISTSGANICSGSSVTLTGGTAGAYSWNTGAVTSSISVSPAVTTTYTLTGSNGTCTSSATAVVTVTTTPTMTITNNNPICSGQSITLNGASAGAYSWNTGAATANITVSPLSNTTYTLTGSNGTCTATAVATVTVNPLPTLTASVVTAAPCGLSTGCINSATAGGGTPAYQYSWAGGPFSGTNSYCNHPAGPYALVIMDANSCTFTTSITIPSASGPSAPTIASSSTLACVGGNVPLSITSPTTGLTFTWTDATGTHSGTTYTVVGIGPAGGYNISVTATDGSGCTSTSTDIITVNPLPTPNPSASPTVICVGQSSVLSASGAATYTWSSGSSIATETVSPIVNTIYTVSATSNMGCVGSGTVQVDVNPLPVITATATPMICATQSATIGANGATSYTWSTGALTQTTTVSPSSNTTYTVTGDNLGCTSTQTVLVNVTPLPTLTLTPSTAGICVGQTATLTATGATTFTWSANAGGGSATTVTVSPVVNTTYTLSGTSSGCSDSVVQTITIGTPPVLSAASTQTLICSTQTATLTTSGTATTFTWMPGPGSGSTFTVSPIVNTTYTVTGSNGGCPSTATVSVNVTATPTLAANSSSGGSICSGQTATLTASGAPSFTWSPIGVSSNTVSVSPIITTSYSVVGDSAGCTSVPQVVTVTVTATPTVAISSSSGAAICSGTSTTLTASGAATYSWSTGPITPGITVSPTSTTQYTVFAANGVCASQDTMTVKVTPTPTLSVTAPPASICAGMTMTLTASGAAHYTWAPNGQTVPTIVESPSVTTTYTVSSDSSGCNASQTVVVNVNPTPSAPIAGVSGASLTECQGTTPGSINVVTTGTVTSFPVWYTTTGVYVTTGTSYSPPTTTPGSTVYVINDSADVTGCKDLSAAGTLTVMVTVNPTPTGPTLGLTPDTLVECEGSTPQSITVATTGTVASTPVWYTSTGTYVYTGTTYTPPTSPAGTTIYVVSDSANVPNGCLSFGAGNVVTLIVTINPLPTGPTPSSGTFTLSECLGSTAQSLSVTPSGTVAATPVWYTSAGVFVFAGNSYTPPTSPVGTTIYTVTDSANVGGCKNLSAGNVQTYTVTINDNPVIVGTPTLSTADCGALTGGVIGLTANSGTPAYTYNWTDGTGATIGTSANLTNVGMGNYNLTVTDANSCSVSSATSYSVLGSAPIVASFTPSATSGQAPLNIVFTNGSTNPANYNWTFDGSGGTSTATNPNFTYNNAGTYTVTLVTSIGTCSATATATITIDVPTSIIIPNIFSPNGDSLNDVFIISCTGMKSLHCDIFNRWGQLVFTLTAPNQNWDGKLNNGNQATEGTYYYMLTAEGEDKKTYTYQGPLTLVK